MCEECPAKYINSLELSLHIALWVSIPFADVSKVDIFPCGFIINILLPFHVEKYTLSFLSIAAPDNILEWPAEVTFDPSGDIICFWFDQVPIIILPVESLTIPPTAPEILVINLDSLSGILKYGSVI